MRTLAVIDFETTGVSPYQGARATEIAAVLVRDGEIVGRYASLMRTGAYVPPFIEALTGISNAMLASAPPATRVMEEVLAFTAGSDFVAHNAHFDRTFWLLEAARAGHPIAARLEFACTLLLSRRLYPEAPNHKLGTLARYHDLPNTGRAHRALADAEVTAHLVMRVQADIGRRFAVELGTDTRVDHALLVAVQRATKRSFARSLAHHIHGWRGKTPAIEPCAGLAASAPCVP